MFYDTFERLCREKGKAVTAVAREIGVSANVPQGWREGSRPRIGTLQKIADYFGVSVDALLEQEPVAPMYPPIITETEMRIVGKLRTLTDEERAAVNAVIDTFAAKHAEEKKTVV